LITGSEYPFGVFKLFLTTMKQTLCI